MAPVLRDITRTVICVFRMQVRNRRLPKMAHARQDGTRMVTIAWQVVRIRKTSFQRMAHVHLAITPTVITA